MAKKTKLGPNGQVLYFSSSDNAYHPASWFADPPERPDSTTGPGGETVYFSSSDNAYHPASWFADPAKRKAQSRARTGAAPKPAPRPAPRPTPAKKAPAKKAPAPAKKAAPQRPTPTRPPAPRRPTPAPRRPPPPLPKRAAPLPSNPGRTELWNDVLNVNPWLRTLGISTARLKQLAATSSGASELLDRLRAEDVVKRRTQAMYRIDGSRRFASEAELFQWENQVRDVLRQAGVFQRPDGVAAYGGPQTLIGFAEADLSPDELRDRLQVWKGVKEGGQQAREIFYVYSGLTFGDDELYEALVDPAKGQALSLLVNKRVGEKLTGPNAFQGWINRARQAGNARVVQSLQKSRRTGSTYAATIQRVLDVDPEFGNRIMDALYSGGDPDAGDFLDLTSLLDAYEFMAVGAAAQGAGLELPTLERLKEIRAAGIERSQAISAYQQFGLDRQKLNAAVLRARGRAFTQRDFEQASFFGDPEAQRLVEAGEAYQQAAGRQQGTFRFDVGRRGQFVQTGLSAR